jgi:hypothetical protein
MIPAYRQGIFQLRLLIERKTEACGLIGYRGLPEVFPFDLLLLLLTLTCYAHSPLSTTQLHINPISTPYQDPAWVRQATRYSCYPQPYDSYLTVALP